jgi:hypothetical protein
VPLAEFVGSFAAPAGPAVPKGLSPAQAAEFLAFVRTTPGGLRNEPMMALLLRLALRAGEAAGLLLDDIAWRQGIITVRGKGSRADQVPLPADVGGPLARYTVALSRDIAHLPNWSAGNMAVIGDAAHPTSPKATQGASLGIEDAAVLAQCLRDIQPIPAALRTFEQLRRERFESIVRSGASAENPTPPTLGSGGSSRPSPVLDHHIDWDQRADRRTC